MNKSSFIRSKKFRYGTVSTVFTVLFIAVVIIFNAIFTALATKYMWYIDMTKESVFTLSDAAKELLGDIDKPVNIYFCQEPDKLEQSAEMRYIYTTAKQLANEFDNINVQCVDVVVNNSFFQRFKTTSNTNIYTTSVIVESGTEFRVFSNQAFYTFSENTGNVFAYNGEAKFVSAILQTTASEDMPIAYFSTQHGEDITSNDALTLINLFYEAGYDVRPIDLTKEEISKDARFLIINNPVYDFLGAEAEDESMNEIAKVDTFLDYFGTLIVFADPEKTESLTNLNEFLEEWGIKFQHNTTLKDTAHAISTDGLSLVANYTSDNLAASLYKDIAELSTMPKTIVRNAMPIELLYDQRSFTGTTRDTSVVLKTYDTADLIENGETIGTGEYNLMTLTRETRIIDNEYYYSYVIACGSTGFATNSYLMSNTYANSDILYSAMRSMGKEKVPADLEFKVLETFELDITTAEANQWTIAVTVTLPVILGVCGVVIWIRRKHA